MKYFHCVVLLLLTVTGAWPQGREYRTHQRGLLHQTVYNTGELGRGYDNGVGGMFEGFSSMEWPPNSSIVIDRTRYEGQHNSFGGGLWMAGTPAPIDTARSRTRKYIYCGATSDGDGNPTPVEGVTPLSISRIENYPVLTNGELNPSYDPDEAEEKIVASWATSLGITVTRTSRAWSYPGYDSFIIYEYELQNSTPDTLKDIGVIWTYALGPSMFGMERTYNRWGEGDYRGQNGEGNHFSRFDLKRWMSYIHSRDGRPDSAYFDLWSRAGNKGGLNSPQAVGLVMLYYDHDHLMTKAQRSAQVWPSPNDTLGSWDSENKLKQPYLLRYENGNLPLTKIQQYLNPAVQRRTGIFVGSADSTRMATQLRPYTDPVTWNYWRGRTKSSANLSWYQPVVRFYGFYPYILLPSQSMRFAFAEVVGYGPGVAGDRIYSDLGGSTRTGVDNGAYFNPVPSWYDTLQYPYLGPKPYIGSTYLQTHPLPWYVTPGVVSIRNVADRAIQMYTGRPLVKYDTLQYEPIGSTVDGRGVYNANHGIPIPIPSPAIKVENSSSGFNRISWKPSVEGISNRFPGLSAPLSYYLVMRSPSWLGPWAVMDSVPRGDPRFLRDSVYLVADTTSLLGSYYYYSVVSVDSSGLRSGITPSLAEHVTQAPAVKSLGKVYAVPNPLIVTNNEPNPDASDPTGEVSDRVYFFGLTKHCTIRIFSYSGQLIETIRHDQEGQGGEGQRLQPFFQVSRNNQVISSGVYYFVVEDAGGAQAHGKFVIIH